MIDIKKILVPIDFSLGSRVALRHAIGVAQRFGATIEVIHSWEPAPVVICEFVSKPDMLILWP